MLLHYYAFEIIPIDGYTITLRSVFRADPQMNSIPQWLINFGSKQFGTFMMQRMLRYSRNIKGTVYEERVKEGPNKETYEWIRSFLRDYY